MTLISGAYFKRTVLVSIYYLYLVREIYAMPVLSKKRLALSFYRNSFPKDPLSNNLKFPISSLIFLHPFCSNYYNYYSI